MSLIDVYSRAALEEMIATSHSYQEVANKIGYTSKSGDLYSMIKNKIIEYGISIDHFSPVVKIKRTPENIFVKDSTADQATVRRWYTNGQYSEYKCAICGQEPVWNNKDLVLTLDHINGNNHDDRLENLRWICPNCDRQLDTFGGRNRTRREPKKKYCVNCGKEISKDATECRACYDETHQSTNRPSKDELMTCIAESGGNFCEVGRNYGVSDNAIRKWCKYYDVAYHSSDYRGITN